MVGIAAFCPKVSQSVLRMDVPSGERSRATTNQFPPVFMTNEEILAGINRRIAIFKADQQSTNRNLASASDEGSSRAHCGGTKRSSKGTAHTREPRPQATQHKPNSKELWIVKAMTRAAYWTDGAECRRNKERTVHTLEVPKLPHQILFKEKKPFEAFSPAGGEEKTDIKEPEKIEVQATLVSHWDPTPNGPVGFQDVQCHHISSDSQGVYSKSNWSPKEKSGIRWRSPAVREEEPDGSDTGLKWEGATQGLPLQPPILKPPQYEPFSDAEDNLSEDNLKSSELQKPTVPVIYEDISEGDSSEGKSTPVPISAGLNRDSVTCKETDVLIISDDESIPEIKPSATQTCCCVLLVETKNGFECLECRTSLPSQTSCQRQSVEGESLSPSDLDGRTSPASVFEEDDLDDLKDDWLLIPVVVSELRWEESHADQSPRTLYEDEHEERPGWATPLSASHLCKSYDLAERCALVPDEGLESKDPFSQSCKNPDPLSDSSDETEDSCSYSPARDGNLLTVSEKIWTGPHAVTEKMLTQTNAETPTVTVCLVHGFPAEQKNSLSDRLPKCSPSPKEGSSNEQGKLFGSAATTSVKQPSTSKGDWLLDGSTSAILLERNFHKNQPKSEPNHQAALSDSDKPSELALLPFNACVVPLPALSIKKTDHVSERKRKFGKSQEKDCVRNRVKKGRFALELATQGDGEDGRGRAMSQGNMMNKNLPSACSKKAKPLDDISAETEDSEDLSDGSGCVSDPQEGTSETFGPLKVSKSADECKKASLQHESLPSKPLTNACKSVRRADSGFQQRSNSYPPPSQFPPTLSANAKVNKAWKEGHVPIRFRRRARSGSEGTKTKALRNPVTGPQRRQSFQKTVTPLMKKTIFEAEERTRDIKCRFKKL